MKQLKHLNPFRFVKTSLSFMKGYPPLKVWAYMPLAYFKYCRYMIKDTILG